MADRLLEVGQDAGSEPSQLLHFRKAGADSVTVGLFGLDDQNVLWAQRTIWDYFNSMEEQEE